MKKTLRITALILALASLLLLCACASADSAASAAAGTYTFYAAVIDGYYIDIPEFEGRTTTLDADGGGALEWGDDNKGPISEWTIDGEKVVIKAGVSEMDATLKDGILSVDLSDDTLTMFVVYVKDGADTSSMPVITSEEYAAILAQQ